MRISTYPENLVTSEPARCEETAENNPEGKSLTSVQQTLEKSLMSVQIRFHNHSTADVWSQIALGGGAVLCLKGCSAAALASPPSCSNQECLQTLLNVPGVEVGGGVEGRHNRPRLGPADLNLLSLNFECT